jgi:hypothetical protein
MRLLITCLLLGVVLNLSAQQKRSISGTVYDAKNGETLIGVAVVDTASGNSAFTNVYGFFSIETGLEDSFLKVMYMGYQQVFIPVNRENQSPLEIKLQESTTVLNEIVVTSKKEDVELTNTEIGTVELGPKKIEKVPVLFGEKDILKTIQLLPGISTVSEGSSNFSVRGGSFDQNLVQLDEAVVFSPSHLLGFFSTFNSDAIKNVKVYKGGIPAEFGGRGSSVLDVQMKEGNNQNFQGKASLGMISSKLLLEGPIQKDRSSFLLSARRTYADLIADLGGFIEDGTKLYFYDLNGKVNYKIGSKDRIFISGYSGQDVFDLNGFGTNWTNQTVTGRWNHILNSEAFSNTTINYSNYDFGFSLDTNASFASGIEDWSVKHDITKYQGQHEFKYGISSIHHTFQPGNLELTNSDITPPLLEQKQALESAVYFSDVLEVNPRLKLDVGLRWSLFQQLGPGSVYTYNDENEIVDSTWFDSNEIAHSFNNFEPRVAMNYQLTSESSIKLGYNRMAQYLHLLSNSTSGQPTDTWVPSSNNVSPMSVDQFSLGYFRNFNSNTYKFSVETYYKNMMNITDYEDGTNLLLNEKIEAMIISGEGRSYGVELLFEKTKGKLTGWASYTLSRSEQLIEGINNNSWYRSNVDKPHDLSLVLSYEFSSRLFLSGSFVYGTGRPVTWPTGQYTIDDNIYPLYSGRNEQRMPDYHRLDLNVTYKTKNDKGQWDFSIYNLYNRKNAYAIDFRYNETTSQNEAVMTYLFGTIPSISYSLNF